MEEIPFCQTLFERAGVQASTRFAADAGLDRMRIRAGEYLTDMIKYGISHTAVTKLVSLDGLPRNREQFQVLAARIMNYPLPELEANFGAVLLGESGLLPDPANSVPHTRRGRRSGDSPQSFLADADESLKRDSV